MAQERGQEGGPALDSQVGADHMGVMVARLFVRGMKTRWGSCSHCQGVILLTTDLATKPPRLLEYVVVHGMSHLLERRPATSVASP